ncbi:hypothetical protein L5515_003583 [Caenorhabditis briggsae]|uniref:THAP-type domain-containing protein n=1 Tax=Caenorhabditis briggsae TaxID=6238 RepID=A0AAE9EI91_CAEBR|nr:hypothetical protein L5515_003583 [Caenorhabditis briggsae]
MSKRIDHDEEDRDSSEYEQMEDEEEDVERFPQQQALYAKEDDHFQPQYITEQVPTTSNQMELPLQIDYEEVYPHSTVPVDNSYNILEDGKVYYENEMEDLVYHEIYGEGSDQKIEMDKRIRNIIGSSASCIVCQRTQSEKIRLFTWPKSEELRVQWLHFFRLPSSVLNSTHESYICCYHFSSDAFIMMDDKICWKKTALPKYRHRRPGLSEPFPWEPSMKIKLSQEIATSAGYRIRYRMPFNKHKTRKVHEVAILTPIAQPHLYYEFHFNRYGLNNTKFYACLSCRKAKTESGIRDVIRTIHLDGYKFLSSGDPFNGHHFACRPHNVYDSKSMWRPVPGQNEDNNAYQGVEYMDTAGESLEWNSMVRPGEGGDVATKDEEPPIILYENFENPISEEVIETDYVLERAATDQVGYPQDPQEEEEEEERIAHNNQSHRKSLSRKARIKCHLCMKSNFSSTQSFVAHLQKHIIDEKPCKKCENLISCDSPSICIRRNLCEKCYST